MYPSGSRWIPIVWCVVPFRWRPEPRGLEPERTAKQRTSFFVVEFVYLFGVFWNLFGFFGTVLANPSTVQSGRVCACGFINKLNPERNELYEKSLNKTFSTVLEWVSIPSGPVLDASKSLNTKVPHNLWIGIEHPSPPFGQYPKVGFFSLTDNFP